jgi:membrane protease subunit HflC
MEAEKTKGEGDAEALKIYAQAYEKDPEFYSFVRTLEAYVNSLGEGTTLVLPGDSEFFKYLSPPTKE